jgi:hypothetical protein
LELHFWRSWPSCCPGARSTGPNGEVRTDDDWELLDRDGKMVACIRQEGDGYWVARPRVTPEPPIEDFKAACQRAVYAAMAILEPHPEAERHPAHPGMTTSQFKATCRDWRRRFPDLSDDEIGQRIAAILKPPAIETGPDRLALIRNAIETELGGGEWHKVVSPDGVVCHVAQARPILEKAAKERQREHGDTAPGRKSPAPMSEQVSDDRSGRVDHQIAQLSGVAPVRSRKLWRSPTTCPSRHSSAATCRAQIGR